MNNKNKNQINKFLKNIMKKIREIKKMTKNNEKINILWINNKHNIVNNKMNYLIMKNKT